MKKILIFTLLLSFIGIDISAQTWTPVFGRQRFNSGLGIPVRDTLIQTAADTSQMVIRPQDGLLYYRRNGAWIKASAPDDYVTIGTAQTITGAKIFDPTLTASGKMARSLLIRGLLTAAVDTDTLVGLDIQPVFNLNSKVGVQRRWLRVGGNYDDSSFSFIKLTNNGTGTNTGASIEWPFNQRIQATFSEGFRFYNRNGTDYWTATANTISWNIAPTLTSSVNNGEFNIKAENGTSSKIIHSVGGYHSFKVYTAPATFTEMVRINSSGLNLLNLAGSGTRMATISSTGLVGTAALPSISGTSGQVSYFNGTNSLTGSPNLTWDNSLARLKAKTIFIDSAETLTNEDDAIYINTTEYSKRIGRGIKAVLNWNGGADAFGSTAIEGQSRVVGDLPKDHSNVFQSFAYKEGTGRMQYFSNFFASKVLTNSNIGRYYGYYYNSGVGTPDSAWSYFSLGPDPAYFSAKVAIADSTLPNASIPFPLFVSKPYVNTSFGFTNAHAGLYSNNFFGIGIGGVLALGGRTGLASDPYPFAFVRGGKSDLTTYAGFLSLHTTSDGINAGEVNGGNYERMRINEKGQVMIGDTVSLGTDIKLSARGGRTYVENLVTDVTAGGNVLWRKAGTNVMMSGVKSGVIGSGNGAITYIYGENPYDIYVNNIKRWGIDSLGYEYLFTTPVTSSSGFDILTRNSATGRTELIPSTSTGTGDFVRANSPTITSASLQGTTVVTSSSTVTNLTINNTGGNFGSNLQLQKDGTTNGFFGTVGALLGTSDLSLATYANTGNGYKVYTNGNNLRIDVTKDGSTIFYDSITAPILLTDRVVSTGTTPSVSLGSNITGSVSVVGTDMAGTITVTVTAISSLATLNELFTLTYNSSYNSIPRVVWSAASVNAAALLQAAGGLYLKNSGTNSFQIATVNSYTTPASATYTFTYNVIQ